MNNVNVEWANRLIKSTGMKNFVFYFNEFCTNPNLAYKIHQEYTNVKLSSAISIATKGKKIFELGYELWVLEKISKSKMADGHVIATAKYLFDNYSKTTLSRINLFPNL